MKNAEFIDQLKPRFSWGKMGNQAVSLYSYLSSVNTSGYDYSFDGTKYGGAAISALADNTITWEETTSYDAGIDFSAFGNRVLFSADWFLKRTEGILRTVNLPSQVGDLSGPKSNVGVVDNKGIELRSRCATRGATSRQASRATSPTRATKSWISTARPKSTAG